MNTVLENNLDSKFKVLCSDTKTESYSYLPLKEALQRIYLRFGNKHFIPAVSIDIDFKEVDIVNILETNNVPFPTFIVHTDKGYHLHWFLKNKISTKNSKQLFLLQTVITTLQSMFKADKYATTKNSARVWRNPLLHKTDFCNRLFDLSEIVTVESEQLDFKVNNLKNKRGYYRSALSVDFSKVNIGNRNAVLFDYGRAYAYTTGVVNVFTVLVTKNLLIPNPLPTNELQSIVKSIENFMLYRYKKTKIPTSEQQITYNRKLAKTSAEKKQKDIVNSLLSLPFSYIIAIKLSARKAATLLKISKDTWIKHKKSVLIDLKGSLLDLQSRLFNYLNETIANKLVENSKLLLRNVNNLPKTQYG